ncbi:MAG: hypothetical protein K6G60_09405 [Lachnospiraceae bacterium]|nr:hypothetical protein [Lachnospiraceae bacterium]
MSILKVFFQAFLAGGIGFFCCITIHELGHVVFGKIKKWVFEYIEVGPFIVYRDIKKYKIKLSLDVRYWGGISLLIPRKITDTFDKDFAFLLLGGPLFSILFGCIVLTFGVIMNNINIIIIGTMSLGIGIICSIPVPIRTGFTYTDGYRYYRIVSSEETRTEEVNQMLVSLALYSSDLIPYEEIISFSKMEFDTAISAVYMHYLLYLLAQKKEDDGLADFEKEKVLKYMGLIPKSLRKQIILN